MKIVRSFSVRLSRKSKETLMISCSTDRRRFVVVGLSIVASILSGTLLPEKIFAGGGIGSPDLKCVSDPNDGSKCAFGGPLDCPATEPPTTGIAFYCSTFHDPRLCNDSPNSSCVVRVDLFDCGNKRDCKNSQDVLDELGNIVKCNQYPKDCT